jgi:hypothetical protein
MQPARYFSGYVAQVVPVLVELHAHHAHAEAQVLVDDLVEGRQLVHEQHVDLGTVVLEPVLRVLAVAQEDARVVEDEPDLRLDDAHQAERDPRGEQRAKAVRPLHVVLDEIVLDPTEDVDVEPGDLRAPADRRHAHQVRLATEGRAAIEHLGRDGRERCPLLPLQL